MGAGILPTTIHKGKLYFLFGKENEYEDSAKGFSDFGGGQDNNESYLDTAVREGSEELTGFLGTESELKEMLMKHGTYNIDYESSTYSTYRTHIFPFEYDAMLPHYYNNNQKFIQKHLDKNIIKESKIFEKSEIRWVCIDNLKRMKPEFRNYFQNIVDMILIDREKIYYFISKAQKYSKKKRTKKTQKKR
jgi:hypothetical protein